MERCERCRGRGLIVIYKYGPFDIVMDAYTEYCPVCGGTGFLKKDEDEDEIEDEEED